MAPKSTKKTSTADRPAGYVIEGKFGGYFVRSRTQDGVWWLISGTGCSCPAGRAGREVCWHRTQVARFCRELNEKHARPVAPAAPASFFVD